MCVFIFHFCVYFCTIFIFIIIIIQIIIVIIIGLSLVNALRTQIAYTCIDDIRPIS